MNKELTNIATATGTYNNLPTSMTSDTSAVALIEGLTITKTADQTSWVNGPLTYTITIDNQATETYATPVITDIIDTTLVSFVPDSVYIDGTKAETSQYNYDEETHTLTVTLTDIPATSKKTVTFQVKKN